MFLSSRILKSANYIERIHPRMMCTTYYSNRRKMPVFCYNPANITVVTYINTFYNLLFSLVYLIPKHNVLIMNGYVNAQISKGSNKFC